MSAPDRIRVRVIRNEGNVTCTLEILKDHSGYFLDVLSVRHYLICQSHPRIEGLLAASATHRGEWLEFGNTSLSLTSDEARRLLCIALIGLNFKREPAQLKEAA